MIFWNPPQWHNASGFMMVEWCNRDGYLQRRYFNPASGYADGSERLATVCNVLEGLLRDRS